MFDFNAFKRQVKQWVRENPDGTVPDLVDFCEEKIPAQQYSAHSWIVDETVSWYRNILSHKEPDQSGYQEMDEAS